MIIINFVFVIILKIDIFHKELYKFQNIKWKLLDILIHTIKNFIVENNKIPAKKRKS